MISARYYSKSASCDTSDRTVPCLSSSWLVFGFTYPVRCTCCKCLCFTWSERSSLGLFAGGIISFSRFIVTGFIILVCGRCSRFFILLTVFHSRGGISCRCLVSLSCGSVAGSILSGSALGFSTIFMAIQSATHPESHCCRRFSYVSCSILMSCSATGCCSDLSSRLFRAAPLSSFTFTAVASSNRVPLSLGW